MAIVGLQRRWACMRHRWKFVTTATVILCLLLNLTFVSPVLAQELPAGPNPADTSADWAEFNREQLGTFRVARIRSALLPGVVIGGHYSGPFKQLQQPYTASGRLEEQLEEAVRQVVADELTQAGYRVAQTDGEGLFEDLLLEEEAARFLIGGKIVQASFNSYHSWWGDRSEDERTVRWMLLDRERNRIVYSHETQGSAIVPGVNNPAATYEAMRASFRDWLAQPQLLAALQQGQVIASVAPTHYEIPARPGMDHPLKADQIAREAVPAIVRVRSPGGRGSGFVIDEAGLVVTNWHVVEDAFSVKIDLYDGASRTGRVVKRDAHTDLALIQLQGAPVDVPALAVCHTQAVKVGEPVVAIGHPLSFTNTVTQGIISGIRRQGDRTLLQTDVAVNPGNSGGPLLNTTGVVVGIVTEKVASRGIEGLSFALPIGEALQKLDVAVMPPNQGDLDRCGNPVRA